MTVVVHYDAQGNEIARVEIKDVDATTFSIARAVIDIVSSRMSVSEGDKITIETV